MKIHMSFDMRSSDGRLAASFQNNVLNVADFSGNMALIKSALCTAPEVRSLMDAVDRQDDVLFASLVREIAARGQPIDDSESSPSLHSPA